MTDEELNEIERRLNAATPGPWFYRSECIGWFYLDHSYCQVDNPANDADANDANRKLTIHAPTDIATLLAEVRNLKSKVTAIEHGEFETWMDNNKQ